MASLEIEGARGARDGGARDARDGGARDRHLFSSYLEALAMFSIAWALRVPWESNVDAVDQAGNLSVTLNGPFGDEDFGRVL